MKLISGMSECSLIGLLSGSPAGPAEPRCSERLSDDRQKPVPPPAGEGCPGVSGEEWSQLQSVRQRPSGADRQQVRMRRKSLRAVSTLAC